MVKTVPQWGHLMLFIISSLDFIITPIITKRSLEDFLYISRIGSLQHHHEYVAILVEHVTFYACNLSNLVHIVE